MILAATVFFTLSVLSAPAFAADFVIHDAKSQPRKQGGSHRARRGQALVYSAAEK
jgi:hypothetical protein